MQCAFIGSSVLPSVVDGFVVFDLMAKTAVGSVGAAPTSSPEHLYSFGRWFNDASFSYHVYQPTDQTGR